MIDGTTRTELFRALESLSSIVLQMRVGQFLAAIGEVSGDLHGRGLWDAEDAELLEAAYRFRQGMATSESITEQTHAPEPPSRQV
jgi:hypothetical protein